MVSVEVNGEVVHPQICSLPAGSTISDALRQAGGFSEFGRQSRIELSRGDKRYLIDFRRIRKDMTYDLMLKNGDRIFVPRSIKIPR